MADQIHDELDRLRAQGAVGPRHTGRAMQDYGEAVLTSRDLLNSAGYDLDRLGARVGRRISAESYDDPEVQAMVKETEGRAKAMGNKRAIAYKQNRMGDKQRYGSTERTDTFGSRLGAYNPTSPMGGDAFNAIPRFYDPLEYWDLSGLPWNVADEGHRHKLHKWLRLYYATHYLIPILVDIFTRFPLVGMELEHKDPQLKQVYEQIFFDNLKYEDYLVSLGREYWVVGEAFPLGSFDEDLGVWEHEELINPEDVVINNFPFLNSKQLKIVPPDYLRRIAQTKSPAREWYMLQENYEDLIPYLLKGEHIPVSPVMMRQVANKLNDWDDHGTPILLRGLRTLLHEEKLLASQDAIAERLYSPFILAKLGIMDMGDGLPPWLPGPGELESVRDDIDIALSSDFRVLVHHFGLELESVFGREQMPRLGDDFDRIERRLMQVFGVNPSLLSAGSNTQPYASSALQAEFMNQILRTFQSMLKNHYKERALVVAEAQGHFDYEMKGKTRVPIYESIVFFDDEGEKHVKEVPKLTVPDLSFATFDLRDQATERQFLMSLRQMGVPIPNENLLIGVPWTWKDEIQKYNRELKEQTIAQQEAKMETYIALTEKGLPVPLDLKAEIESVLVHGAGAGGGAPQGATKQVGPSGAAGGGGGAPGGQIVMPPPPAGLGGAQGQPQLGPGAQPGPPGGGAPPMSPTPAGGSGNAPPVSNERRPGLKYNTALRKGSALDQFLSDYQLGVPFIDYLADRDVDFNKVSRDELHTFYDEWPKHADAYQHRVTEAVRDKLAEARWQAFSETPANVEPTEDDEPKLVLAANQELKQDKERGEFILEKRSKRRIKVEIPPHKKYSVIDPLGAADKEKQKIRWQTITKVEDEPTEHEPVGPGTSIQSDQATD